MSITFASVGQTQSTRTLQSELNQFIQIEKLPGYEEHSRIAQVSSWDTTHGNDDGFSGKYSFLRRNPDSSLVLVDLDGPGVIERIWTPTPTKDTMDFYIDGASRPTLSIAFGDLFSGKVYPFVAPLCDTAAGGYYCYFPILFQQHCKVVCRGKHVQFHQWQYRLFEKGTKVQSFVASLSEQEKQTLAKVGEHWTQPVSGPNQTLQSIDTNVVLLPGKSVTVFNHLKGGRIIDFQITTPAFFEHPDSLISLKIFWDNQKSPAIDCPVQDFFGFAFEKPAMKGLLIGSSAGTLYCRLPMPFDHSARIELSSRSSSPVPFAVAVRYTGEKRDADREGKLYVYRNGDYPGEKEKHLIVNASGKGHYVGTILIAQGQKKGNTLFFEGDDSTAIDGQFRIHGTGSEDYFNGGWYMVKGRWDTVRSQPLSGCLGYSAPAGHTGGYRFYLGDKLSFSRSLYMAIEHGPDPLHQLPVRYTSLGFYYSDRPKSFN
ncbi:MAG TPA: glycoside hydrolase family 172 protein [Puia sp.]